MPIRCRRLIIFAAALLRPGNPDKKNLSEGPILRPGDTVLLSKSALGKMAPVLTRLGVGLHLNPLDLAR